MQINKKRSSLVLGIFLILAIGVTVILIQQGILIVTRARPTAVPQNVQMTNISDSSFTVVFTTELKTSAIIRLAGESTGNTIILDDRDKATGAQNEYFSHHITVPNLEPQRTYSFSIVSNGKEYSSPAQYMITTGPQIESAPPSQNPLFGKIILPDGSDGADTLILAKSDNSQIVSSITNNSGNYILPTNSLKNESLSEYQILSPSSPVFLTFFRESYSARITSDFQLAQNLPPVTLNQDYSFLPSTQTIINQPQSGFENFEEPSQSSSEPVVISPRDNQSFVDSRPTFSGTGGINRKAFITIPSVGINESVDISAQRRWTFRPENDIPQGEHSATFDIQDDNGVKVRITRLFSIFASGTQVAQSATPSATPTFTPSPTTIPPTPTVSISVSPSPTGETPSPSPASTSITPSPTSVLPTATPTSSIVLTPTGSEILPSSTPLPPIDNPGDINSSAVLAVVSILLIVAGAAIFFAL